MLATTVLAMTIALIVYAYMGMSYAGQHADWTEINLLRETLANHYNISVINLLPAVVVIVCAKMPLLPCLPKTKRKTQASYLS